MTDIPLTPPLPYAAPIPRKFSKLAIGTMIVGLLSGPLQIAWDWQPLQYNSDNLALGIFLYIALIPAIAVALNLLAYFHIRRTPTLRGQWFAHVGVLVSVLSAGAIAGLCYVIAHIHGVC